MNHKKIGFRLQKSDGDYFFYSIEIDGEWIGGGAHNLNHALESLCSYIIKEADKMPNLSREETGKWIDEGMWNRDEEVII